ncbi:putative ribonuclease H-like domain-containing protein [Tanacetum coccineum]
MRPFGCPMTILNTLDPLGKFDEKADEAFFVGYFINRKAFRVFNIRTSKVEENLHINFLKNKPNVAGSKPDWLFDIDLLTNSMNYELVTAENQTNGYVGIETNDNAGQAGQEKAANHEYILQPFLTSDSSSTQSSDDKDADEVPGKGDEGVNKVSGSDDQERIDCSTQDINTAITNINTSSLNINIVSTNDPNMPSLEETDIFDGAYDDEDVGAEAGLNNLETTMNVWTLVDLPKGKRAIVTKWVYRNKKYERGIVVRNKERLVAQGYTQEEGIYYDEVFALVARIEAIKLFLAYASFMGLIVYQIDVKSAFLYGTIEEEVYVCQSPGFEDPQFLDKVEKALYGLHQAPKAWYKTLSTYLLENGYRKGNIDKTLFIKKDRGDILLVQKEDGIFISQEKYVVNILKKFDFTTVKATRTPIETNKALNKDEKAKDVDVHLYRSIIRSLMYLTASRPDIMFVVCACARDSPFELEAFSDSDYAGDSLDRKSTTGAEVDEGSGQPTDPQHTFTSAQRSNEESIISSGPIHLVADETVYKEWKDRMERAATTASSLEVEQDSGNINRTQSMATLNESLP